MDTVTKLASQKAVVIFSVSSCCMCHTIKSLFLDLGVNPTIYEIDEEPLRKEMEVGLTMLLGQSSYVPAVFIGGRFVGSTKNIMSLHLGGKLIPMLMDAGALWL